MSKSHLSNLHKKKATSVTQFNKTYHGTLVPKILLSRLESQYYYNLECKGCFCQSVRWWVFVRSGHIQQLLKDFKSKYHIYSFSHLPLHILISCTTGNVFQAAPHSNTLILCYIVQQLFSIVPAFIPDTVRGLRTR